MKLCKPSQITIPLDIPDVAVVKTEITADRKFIITVESQVETTECGICHREIKCSYGHGGEIELRHLAILGYKTYIRLKPRRGQCQTCETKPTTTQQLKWYESRSPHTKPYDAYLVKQLIHSTLVEMQAFAAQL